MLNRRLIRIKAFKTLFSYEFSGADSPAFASEQLMRSCEGALDLYYFMMNVTGAVVSVAREKIDAAMHKFHPTEEDMNPNMRFVDNGFTALVDADPDFGKVCLKKGLTWGDYDIFVKRLLASITSSEYFKEYMESGQSGFKEDCLLWKRVFEEEFEDNEMLETILEDRNPDWSDDLNFVLNVIIKDIDLIQNSHKLPREKTFLKDDDREFARTLLSESILGFDEYRNLLMENLDNWDSDRLVSTDVTLIVMGIAEAVNFPTIPVKATINEYVEISKFYSTPNSKVFVNGILDKVIKAKLASGEITKVGSAAQM